MAFSLDMCLHLVTLFFLSNRTAYEDCTNFDLIGKNTYIDYENDDKIEETFIVSCYEKEEAFIAFFGIFLIFVPGLALSVILGRFIY